MTPAVARLFMTPPVFQFTTSGIISVQEPPFRQKTPTSETGPGAPAELGAEGADGVVPVAGVTGGTDAAGLAELTAPAPFLTIATRTFSETPACLRASISSALSEKFVAWEAIIGTISSSLRPALDSLRMVSLVSTSWPADIRAKLNRRRRCVKRRFRRMEESFLQRDRSECIRKILR